MELKNLLVFAFVIEGIVGYSKLFFVERKFQWQVLSAIGLGVLLALVYQIDFFAMLKMETDVPYIGQVLTGLLVARGSNYTADLIKLLGQHTERVKIENAKSKAEQEK